MSTLSYYDPPEHTAEEVLAALDALIEEQELAEYFKSSGPIRSLVRSMGWTPDLHDHGMGANYYLVIRHPGVGAVALTISLKVVEQVRS